MCRWGSSGNDSLMRVLSIWKGDRAHRCFPVDSSGVPLKRHLQFISTICTRPTRFLHWMPSIRINVIRKLAATSAALPWPGSDMIFGSAPTSFFNALTLSSTLPRAHCIDIFSTVKPASSFQENGRIGTKVSSRTFKSDNTKCLLGIERL